MKKSRIPSPKLQRCLFRSGLRAPTAPIHRFETMFGEVWKPAIHHARRMARRPCRNSSQCAPGDRLDLAPASGVLHGM